MHMAAVDFGNTWWGGKWLDALSGIDYANRLPRGKTYARKGAVKKLTLSAGQIRARVRGSRPSPYDVTISLPKFTEKHKKDILAAIVDNPFFLAQLLNRKLPTGL